MLFCDRVVGIGPERHFALIPKYPTHVHNKMMETDAVLQGIVDIINTGTVQQLAGPDWVANRKTGVPRVSFQSGK